MNYRSAFEIPRDIAYFNCAFHSPLLVAAREAGEVGVKNRAQPWKMTPEVLFQDIEKSRNLFAQMIKGEAEGVAIIPSVSYGVGIAARNLHLKPKSRVLIPEGDFPSNVYVWRELAKEKDLEILTVPKPSDYDWTRAMLDALDERVSVVSAPPCHWCDGAKFDLKRIGQKARDVGAKFIIDGSQAIGTLPVEVNEWNPDYLVCVGYKWLLGPYGVSYLYLPERSREGKPIEFSWLNRKGCEDFSRLCDYTDELSTGARRFDVGQKSNPILLPMANAAMSSLLDWGLPQIAKQITSTSQAIGDALGKFGLSLLPAERRMNHILGVPTPHAREWAKQLAENRVYASARHDALRISPHVYNDAEDIARFANAFSQIRF